MTRTNVDVHRLFNTCKFLDNEIMRNNYDKNYRVYFIDEYSDKNCALLENKFLGNHAYNPKFPKQFYTPYYTFKGRSYHPSFVETFQSNEHNSYIIYIVILILLVMYKILN